MSVEQFVWEPFIVKRFVWELFIVKRFVWRDLSHSGMIVGMRNNGVIVWYFEKRIGKGGQYLIQPEPPYSYLPVPPPFKFHSAGGRSLSVSSEALKRVRSILGDPDIGAFLNEGDAFDMGLSF
ncbi:hypothetical protein OIU78_019307 [Salix suchowensis]|nr:hypothetical protein OIU78_019307 [Salix suchowensis]